MPLESSTFLSSALEVAHRRALAYAEALDGQPVAAVADADTLRRRLMRPLNADPIDAGQVIDELADDVAEGLSAVAGGRFFGWVMGGALPAAAAIVEEACGAWLKDLLGLPPSASFALTTGCQMAHATCLAAARHAVLAQRSWDVERRGLYGAPSIRVVSSTNRHASIDRAVRLLGFGTDCIEYLDPGTDETMSARRLFYCKPAISIRARSTILQG